MPMPLTVSCFSKIQIGFTFLVPAHPVSPGQRAVKRVCGNKIWSVLPLLLKLRPYGRMCVALLSMPSVLGHLVACQEQHAACRNWVMGWRCGYLSGAKCRLFAYSPADATAIPKPHHLWPHLNPAGFIFLVLAYPGCHGQVAVNRVQ